MSRARSRPGRASTPTLCPRLPRAETSGGQKEHLAGRVFSVEPDEREMREFTLELLARATDLADERPACSQMLGRLAQYPAHDVQPIRSPCMRHNRLGRIFGRKARDRGCIDIRRVRQDQIETF